MNIFKGLDGQAEKVIDQAADAAKQKVQSIVGGGGAAASGSSGASGTGGKEKNHQQGGGIGGKMNDAFTKAASQAVVDKATEEAMAFGKKLIG